MKQDIQGLNSNDGNNYLVLKTIYFYVAFFYIPNIFLTLHFGRLYVRYQKHIISIDCSLDTFRCRRSLQWLLNLKNGNIFFIVGMYLSIPMQFIETRDTYHIILLCVSTITYFAIICRPKGPLVPPAWIFNYTIFLASFIPYLMSIYTRAKGLFRVLNESITSSH